MPGARVGIYLPNSAEFATLYFACLLGGFTAVPINSALPARDREFVLSRSQLSVLIVDPSTRADLEGRQCVDGANAIVGVRTLVMRGFADVAASVDDFVLGRASEADAASLLASVDGKRLFSIHFTSGTTSLPKGVPHRVASLLGNAMAFDRAFGVTEQSRFLHVMPMTYMAGFLNTLLCPFAAGASVVLAPQFTAQSGLRFWEPVVAHKADTFWVSPTMLAALIKIDRGPLGVEYCRAHQPQIFSATAPLPLKVRKDFHVKYGVDVIESYGLSELLLITANLGPAGTKDGAVGTRIAEADVEIRSEDGAGLPSGQDGGIFVRTPHMSQGYLNYDTGAVEPFANPWFDTGDIGHFDQDGYLFVTGRQKDLIIRGGFNISPRQVEEILLRHPAVEEVAVVGAPHDFYGEEIVAALIVKSGYSLADLQNDLRALCRNELGGHATPDRFVSFVSFPVSTTGKVQKGKVREQIVGGVVL